MQRDKGKQAPASAGMTRKKGGGDEREEDVTEGKSARVTTGINERGLWKKKARGGEKMDEITRSRYFKMAQ